MHDNEERWMETSVPNGEGVRWDLSELYAGPEDPRIEGDLAEARRRANVFAETYRGTLAGFDGATLSRVLAEYEALSEVLYRPSFYAGLFFAGDTQNARAQQLVQRTREATTATANLLIFFALELVAFGDEHVAELMLAKEMTGYAHYLDMLRRFKPHTLSEKEEQLLNQKSLTGRSAFEQLYDELCGSLRFNLTIGEEERELTDSEVMALLRHPSRDLREQAFSVFLDTHGRNALVLTSVFNNVFLDHKVDCDLRQYDDIVMPTHLGNEIAPETVKAMMLAVERHYGLAQEYFRLKARLIGVGKLKNSDLYAPIVSDTEKIPFSEARSLVLTAFGKFSERFALMAGEFFTNRWIDAEIRQGKRGGAFCASLSPNHHPYVLSSYTGTGRDVSTIAHELGHGIHYQLSRCQTWVNHDAPLVLAETASVFAEVTLTRHLLETSKSVSVRRGLLCDLLDDIYGTVFRQTALTRFEMAAHEKRKSGQLSADDLCGLWLEEQEKLFGDSVEMIPAYRWGWAYIAHFVHSRFYCYSYSFGELLTLALFQRYLDEGEAFVPGYIRLLEGGGSQRPDQALAQLGIDINQPEFWDRGFRVIEGFLADLKATL
jgi:oligoendopeptidase F